MQLGFKFWAALFGGALACGIAAIVLFLLLDGAFYRWGFFGMFLFLSALLLLFGWIVDRREKRRRNEFLDAVGENPGAP